MCSIDGKVCSIECKAGFALANFYARSDFFLLSKPYHPLGFSRKLKEKGKKSLRAKIFASGKPA